MLILERRVGRSVRIGKDITVTVHRVRSRNAVRLAISAPKHIPIVRDEFIDIDSDTEILAVKTQEDDPQEFRVTLIEDDPNDVMLIRAALDQQGVEEVTVYDTGRTAVSQILSSDQCAVIKPSLILLDLTLPDIDGLEVLRTLRQRKDFEKIPVVVLSGIESDPKIPSCLESGANAIVIKSVGFNELKDSVGKIADLWKRSPRQKSLQVA